MVEPTHNSGSNQEQDSGSLEGVATKKTVVRLITKAATTHNIPILRLCTLSEFTGTYFFRTTGRFIVVLLGTFCGGGSASEIVHHAYVVTFALPVPVTERDLTHLEQYYLLGESRVKKEGVEYSDGNEVVICRPQKSSHCEWTMSA